MCWLRATTSSSSSREPWKAGEAREGASRELVAAACVLLAVSNEGTSETQDSLWCPRVVLLYSVRGTTSAASLWGAFFVLRYPSIAKIARHMLAYPPGAIIFMQGTHRFRPSAATATANSQCGSSSIVARDLDNVAINRLSSHIAPHHLLSRGSTTPHMFFHVRGSSSER